MSIVGDGPLRLGDDEAVGAGGQASAEESVGIQLTVDLMSQLRRIAGLAGIHLMCLGREDTVRKVVEGAGLLSRPTVPEIAAVPPGSGPRDRP